MEKEKCDKTFVKFPPLISYSHSSKRACGLHFFEPTDQPASSSVDGRMDGCGNAENEVGHGVKKAEKEPLSGKQRKK